MGLLETHYVAINQQEESSYPPAPSNASDDAIFSSFADISLCMNDVLKSSNFHVDVCDGVCDKPTTTSIQPLISTLQDSSIPSLSSSSDQMLKLDRINQLLAEAVKLQQEVFG